MASTPRGRPPRTRRDDPFDYDRPRRPQHRPHEDVRAGGLARDYYEGHPANPNPDGRHHRPKPQRSKTDRAISALEEGDFKGAFHVVMPRSKSTRPTERAPHQQRPRRRDDSLDRDRDHDRDRRRRNDGSSDWDRDHDRDRRHGQRHSPERRGRAHSADRAEPSKPSKERDRKWELAAGAALTAGAVEAFRLSRQPGGWNGGKAAKVATAALSAAAVNGGRGGNKKRNVTAGATIGGLLLNQITNGKKNRR